jgi:hypothetical protein
MRWDQQLIDAAHDFKKVALLGREPMDEQSLVMEFLPAPHISPSRLPVGKVAIYTFWGDGSWLKIGKVGPNSAARYTSQHYNPNSANSNLAKSISKCGMISARSDFHSDRPGDWIRQFCHRANLLLPESCSRELLACLEAFLHLRLHPRFEH